MLFFDKIKFEYENEHKNMVQILDNVNIDINEGEIVAIVGPSGCGKSTLLKIISKITNIQSLAFMIQDAALLPWKNVVQNIEILADIKNIKLTNQKELLQLVNLKDVVSKYPNKLSGGEKQRVALARTLSLNPKLLLLDEPLSQVDDFTALEILTIISKSVIKNKTYCLLVTHNIEQSVMVADRVIVLSNKPAKVIQTVKIKTEHLRNINFMNSDYFFQKVKEVRESFFKAF